MENETDKLIAEQLKMLSPSLQQAISAVPWRNLVQEIGQKNNLTVDTYALDKDYITVTPVHCDLTDYDCLADLKKWNLKI